MPDVSDPLLETPPPPTNVLQSWQQALQLVRDQSVKYMRLARVNVQRAEAQVRSALAPALPQLLAALAGVTKYLLKGEVQTANGPVYDPRSIGVLERGSSRLTVPIFPPLRLVELMAARKTQSRRRNCRARKLNGRSLPASPA